MKLHQPALLPLAIEHAEAIQELASHPDIAATTRIPHPYPEGAAREYVLASMQQYQEGKSVACAITDQGIFVGVCTLMDIVPRHKAELGYWIGKPYWGKGYASFAVRTILPVAFNELQLQLVFAVVLESNNTSAEILKKNGFVFQHKRLHNSPKWPAKEKICFYELTRETWQTRHSNM